MHFQVPKMNQYCTVSVLARLCQLSLVSNLCSFPLKIQCAVLCISFIGLSFINHKFSAGKNVSLLFVRDNILEIHIFSVHGCQALVTQLIKCESSSNYHNRNVCFREFEKYSSVKRN